MNAAAWLNSRSDAAQILGRVYTMTLTLMQMLSKRQRLSLRWLLSLWLFLLFLILLLFSDLVMRCPVRGRGEIGSGIRRDTGTCCPDVIFVFGEVSSLTVDGGIDGATGEETVRL